MSIRANLPPKARSASCTVTSGLRRVLGEKSPASRRIVAMASKRGEPTPLTASQPPTNTYSKFISWPKQAQRGINDAMLAAFLFENQIKRTQVHMAQKLPYRYCYPPLCAAVIHKHMCGNAWPCLATRVPMASVQSLLYICLVMYGPRNLPASHGAEAHVAADRS